MNEYNLLLRSARWLRRFRKRRGYGVHSPFAYDFITGVIYNAEAYYAYESLRQPLAASITRLDEYDPASGLAAKDLRLLFRLANWAEPSSVLLCGASPTVEAYIAAARPSATFGGLADADAACTFIYCDSTAHLASLPARLLSPLSTAQTEGAQTVIVVRGIHADAVARRCWEQLKALPVSTVTFDLGRFGIVISYPKINSQHYIIDYF